MFDVLIKNAKVFDGTGTPFYFADIGLKGGKICAVGKNLGEAGRVFDAGGLAVSPGFIDAHSHVDLEMDLYPDSQWKLTQGVTTEVSGSCGLSQAPISKEHFEDGLRVCSRQGRAPFDPEKRATFSAFMRDVDINYGPNMALQLGHASARAAASGYADRELTSAEMDRLKGYVEDAMQAGAFGISFGLIYPPSSYGEERELTELCKIVARYGGAFTTHMRNEGANLLESVEETIRMARDSGCRGIISHHKVSGKANHGKSAQTLDLIDQANAAGIEIFMDQYPYSASSTSLNIMIPNHMHPLGVNKLVEMLGSKDGRAELRREIEKDRGVPPGGDVSATMDYIMIGSCPSHPEYGGKMLFDIAKGLGADPCDVMMDILRDDRLGTGAIYFTMSEADIVRVMRHPRTMVGTDGLYIPGRVSHPRAVGTFPRFLGRYVRDKELMPMEEAIRKITAMPAAVHRLHGKGLIKPGLDADLVIFNPDTVIDNADYADYTAKNTGIETVFVAGDAVVENGEYNGKRLGRLLRA